MSFTATPPTQPPELEPLTQPTQPPDTASVSLVGAPGVPVPVFPTLSEVPCDDSDEDIIIPATPPPPASLPVGPERAPSAASSQRSHSPSQSQQTRSGSCVSSIAQKECSGVTIHVPGHLSRVTYNTQSYKNDTTGEIELSVTRPSSGSPHSFSVYPGVGVNFADVLHYIQCLIPFEEDLNSGHTDGYQQSKQSLQETLCEPLAVAPNQLQAAEDCDSRHSFLVSLYNQVDKEDVLPEYNAALGVYSWTRVPFKRASDMQTGFHSGLHLLHEFRLALCEAGLYVDEWLCHVKCEYSTSKLAPARTIPVISFPALAMLDYWLRSSCCRVFRGSELFRQRFTMPSLGANTLIQWMFLAGHVDLYATTRLLQAKFQIFDRLKLPIPQHLNPVEIPVSDHNSCLFMSGMDESVPVTKGSNKRKKICLCSQTQQFLQSKERVQAQQAEGFQTPAKKHKSANSCCVSPMAKGVGAAAVVHPLSSAVFLLS